MKHSFLVILDLAPSEIANLDSTIDNIAESLELDSFVVSSISPQKPEEQQEQQ